MRCFKDFWTLLLRYVFFWGISSHCSLRKHPFLLALHRWGRFARRNIPRYEERGETDVFAGYCHCYQTSRLEALQHLFILRNLSFNSTDHFLEFLICPVTVCSMGPVLFCCFESTRTAELLHLFQYKVIQIYVTLICSHKKPLLMCLSGCCVAAKEWPTLAFQVSILLTH